MVLSKTQKRWWGGFFALAIALSAALVGATPAKAAAGGDAFTVVNHIIIKLSKDMNSSTIEGPSIGPEPLTFAQVNQMFLDAGGTGQFVTYQNGTYVANFEHAAVKSTVDGEDVYFNLGHMLLGDPYNTLFQNGNAITVEGSGSITFENLDVSILPNSAGSGTNGTNTGENVSNGLLSNTNSIISVTEGCTVTMGDGVNIDTATPSDNGGRTVDCGALYASNGGTINVGESSSSSSGPVIKGSANGTGTGKVHIVNGLVTEVANNSVVTGGSNIITATVGNQTIMGSSPLNLSDVNLPKGTLTVTGAPANASIIVPSGTEVKNSTSNTITYGNGSTTNTLQPQGSGTAQDLTPAQALQLAITNAEADYPESSSNYYTSASWAAYQTALANAKAIAQNPSATPAQINAAATALQDALSGLTVVTASMQALQQAIEDAQKSAGTNSALYTEASWSAYQTALKAAQAMLQDATATSAQMNGVRSNLQVALAGLVAIDTVQVTRLVNPYNNGHLITIDPKEVADLEAKGWVNETEGGKNPLDEFTVYESEGVPVWRLYNPYDHEHLYTTDEDEKTSLDAKGWEVDFEGQPAFYGTDNTTYPVYRLYNEWLTENRHLWTVDENEFDELVTLGWADEYEGGQGPSIFYAVAIGPVESSSALSVR